MVSLFPKKLNYRIFEYIFLSSNRVTNLDEYELFKEEQLDFHFHLNNKLKRKLLDVNYPVSRISKFTFFNNRKLNLFPQVFDPRPETELLIEVTNQLVKELGLNHFSYIDLCSGSGAIYISLLLKLRNKISNSAAVDCSFISCHNILKNCTQLKINSYPKVYLSNWVSFLRSNSLWEVITINPPYLANKEWTPELKYDSRSSLVAKNEGLYHYEKLLGYLRSNNHWKLVVLECSELHENYWNRIINFYTDWRIKKYKDYLYKLRVIAITKR